MKAQNCYIFQVTIGQQKRRDNPRSLRRLIYHLDFDITHLKRQYRESVCGTYCFVNNDENCL